MDPDLERRIRLAYEAFEHGDMESVLANFDAGTQMATPEYALESGETEGREAAAAAIRGTLEWMRLDSLDIEELVEGPTGTLVMIRMRGEGRASGVPVDVRYAHAIEFEDDRVARLTWFETREEGLAAIGLS